jgi:hypothetical protein
VPASGGTVVLVAGVLLPPPHAAMTKDAASMLINFIGFVLFCMNNSLDRIYVAWQNKIFIQLAHIQYCETVRKKSSSI